MSFNFIAAVTVHSDFETQENKICPSFHFSGFYLPEVMGLDARHGGTLFLNIFFKKCQFTTSPNFCCPLMVIITEIGRNIVCHCRV